MQKLRYQREKQAFSKVSSYNNNALNKSKYCVQYGCRCQCVIDVSRQRTSEMLYETIAVSLLSVAGALLLFADRGFTSSIVPALSDFTAKETLLAV